MKSVLQSEFKRKIGTKMSRVLGAVPSQSNEVKTSLHLYTKSKQINFILLFFSQVCN